jgi:2-hydroxy-6-oxonona-2,4-dienedioate hydrolase
LFFHQAVQPKQCGSDDATKEKQMVTTAGTVRSMTRSVSPRYRAAEAALWSAHGLQPTEHLVELPEFGTTIRVIEVGAGPPALFVPGTGGTGPYWAPLVATLTHRRCLLVDRPGWGLSGPVDYRAGNYGQLAAGVLKGVVDQLGIEQLDVIGASIGALWALRLAQREPARVRQLVLLGGFPNSEVPIPTFIKLLRSPIGAFMVRLPMRPGMLRQQLTALGHGRTLERGKLDGFMEWRLAFQRETRSMHHERDMVRAIIGREGFRSGVTLARDEIAGINHATLMVFGANDPTGSVETWRRFTDAMPRADLRIVEDAGHSPWWDDADAVGRMVEEHLTAKLA